jgi:hypothetical protein
MPRYKFFHLRDSLVQRFRESAPKPKPYGLRRQDYEEEGAIEAMGPYGAWKQLRENSEEGSERREFGVGDALESPASELIVLNHWGFDEAEWRLEDSAAEVAETEVAGEAVAVSPS